jgi:hypothetical protein
MARIFPRWTNLVPLALAVALPAGAVATVGGAWYWFSPKYTDVGYQPEQPVAYSHALHAGRLGMDCRYCHDTAERAGYAAVPPTQTCMNCHAVVKKDSPLLEKVRASWETGEPLHWQRVHILPDYAYFNHSAHLAAGVGCVSCHGRVDQMEVVRQEKPLSMSWCLDCHRNPTPNLRPRSEVTNMAWDAKAAGYDPAKDPARTRQVKPPQYCSGCHR